MRNSCYLFVSLTLGIFAVMLVSAPVFAARVSQCGAPDMTLVTFFDGGVVGEGITWHLMIEPIQDQALVNLSVQPANPELWFWPDTPQPVEALTRNLVLDIEAVPRSTGNLIPAVAITYTISDVVHTRIVMGEGPIHIQPVAARVQSGIAIDQKTVRVRDVLTAELWVYNGSPFTLTNMTVEGSGMDLQWYTMLQSNAILPNERYTHAMSVTVRGPNPVPRLAVVYNWQDSVNQSHTYTTYVTGQELIGKEFILGRIPDELLGIFFGIVVGALSTFLTGFVSERLKRKLQREADRRKVYGLLRMMVMQSKYAADHSVDVELKPLEALFEQEGLYAIMTRDKLDKQVQALWEAAIHHNKGLSLPGGTQRSKDLKDAAKKLQKRLYLPERSFNTTDEYIGRSSDYDSPKSEV